MCGRFTLTVDAETLEEAYQIEDMSGDWSPRYNIAPTQSVAVLVSSQKRQLEWMRWGLVPSWAKDISVGNQMINARSETLVEKPSFRKAFQKGRCLILADGFFEWAKEEKYKVPYYFSLTGRQPFAFAGLSENWRDSQGNSLKSCSIITCQANTLVGQFHDRMPVILTGESLWAWLDDGKTEMELKAMLQPFRPELMKSTRVSTLVNNPALDVPECVIPVME
jgi:putative SOS response-associated peptidase YedK